jgi:cytochrome c oxidase cbb3-type subunit I/II
MWKQFLPEGMLQYGNFLETVDAIMPMYAMRAFGGTIYVAGVVLMIYNLIKTVQKGNFIADEPAAAPPLTESPAGHKGEYWHRWIERRPVQLLIGSTVVILIGGLAEVFPMVMVEDNVPKIASVKPYTPLELTGRDIYIREGCNNCHSQMIRPFRSETERYGQYSMSGEFIYDRPHLWGSKRTGPDVHRVGGKYPDSWHYRHMENPQSTSPGSIMPTYEWMLANKLDLSDLPAKIRTLQLLGTPYAAGYDELAIGEATEQAAEIAESLRADGIKDAALQEKEIVAIIAYLQRLGTDIKTTKK